MLISKSDFILFLAHPAWMWLKLHQKHKLPPIDAQLQRIFDTGHLFESYAQQLFPDGVTLGFHDYADYNSLTDRTQHQIATGTQTIFQGRFSSNRLTCIVDVLNRVGESTFELIEIKSSTGVKPEHLSDLAFQTLVLESTGLKVHSLSVIHVNKDYVRQGSIEPGLLCLRTDVTDQVRAIITQTQVRIDQALTIAAQSSIPDISPRFAAPGALQDWLKIYPTLRSDLDNYNIYQLISPGVDRLTQLEDRGVSYIKDIPDDIRLSPRQQAQAQTVNSGRRLINRPPIQEFISGLSFPLYFLDYETFGDLIPPFDGIKPYQQLPFQYSLHLLETPQSRPQHFDYLHTDHTHPVTPFTRHLQDHIGQEGTVLVWNQAFEKNINSLMGQMLPDYHDFYHHLNLRIQDLMLPFSKNWFVDKDFFGSASLKTVLPVLVPKLSYQNLDVSDGRQAQRLWMDTFLYGRAPYPTERVIQNLLDYCCLDTLAMVKIYQFLSRKLS